MQYAVALGAKTDALTHSPGKENDCKRMGSKDVIVTGKEGWQEPHKFKFDLILNCANVTDRFDIPSYFSLLKPGSDFYMLSGSHIGNHQEMEALLKLAAEKGVKPWVETIDVSEEGCKHAVERLEDNKVAYRFTLTGFDKALGRA
ncbi:NADP-dependent alcohol dehydrogenase C [Hirsutella rhossiliensis]|uniref:NADP-dependent alcohol dehydrogenase C n=1 Tax=Hirsutella rhossiliensis TaxID=111463 RepID=A0A9P8SN00_9HYPO|nr:NADP-dependent alcohol dehydrogenase C [Hirsutella rhossiliensis]KAH0967849.1 NADP-dependent alcohol dehydrogenase C [Hirsutella rhossiliensis]